MKGRSQKNQSLITAAGLGKRFGALTRETNKCLLSIAGKPVILHLLDRLESAGIEEMIVVSGYQHAKLLKLIEKRATIVFNPFYRVSGILGSFWAAREWLSGSPFLFTTADHFFHSSVLADCLKVKGELSVVVQTKKRYTREDAKVVIRSGSVARMGKEIPIAEAEGEFGGMALFGSRGSALFFQELESSFEKGGLNGYMMEILMSVSHRYALPVRYSTCRENSRIEIDSVHDLVAARRLAQLF
ncbi:MAG: NTP transferase domain-containing protein [Deltaproteobacteria bacterium]|nr:NTP transferase domain-containing protein [Deltaproteobacteria bacterium]